MSFASFETGPEGYPIELYLFKRGLSERYTLTSSDSVIDYLSEQYLPIQIERGKVEVNTEMERSPIKIKIQRNAELLTNFVTFPPTEIMTLTISRFHKNDTPTPEVAVVWQGRVLSAEWQGSQATLDCEPVFTSLKRPGLRRKYQAQCPHILYGAECKLDRFVYDVTDNLTAVSGSVISAPAFAISVDYFFGGYVDFGNRLFRSIIGDDGAGNLTLSVPMTELEIGSTLTAFPGCAHDLDACENKFNNVINYGGFPYVPAVNPFGGTALF
jgi:uncharacterized phage protein (TIGR02218 family)